MARALADRIRCEQRDALMIDGDGEIGNLYQFYAKGEPVPGQIENGVAPIHFTGPEQERDQLLATVDLGRPVILADMPAAPLTQLKQFDGDTGFFAELTRSGYRPTFVNVLSPFSASTRTVREMIELAGKQADYVVTLNQWFGDHEDFFMWYGHANSPPSSGYTMRPDYGGVEIAFPRLQAGLLVAIDELLLTVSDAREDTRLTTLQRSRLHRWMQAVDAEPDEVTGYLGLTRRQ
ncbi:cobalamin biosynthesis protein CobQ [Paraburkholderia gardini]|nr:cobalamin biosynthesis protein CobQ [Paraburkholderia gardini]